MTGADAHDTRPPKRRVWAWDKAHSLGYEVPEETKPQFTVSRETLPALKARARAYANVYRGRGYLKSQGCAVCGDPDTQMHHFDYERPVDVIWLCRPHHKAAHRGEVSCDDLPISRPQWKRRPNRSRFKRDLTHLNSDGHRNPPLPSG